MKFIVQESLLDPKPTTVMRERPLFRLVYVV